MRISLEWLSQYVDISGLSPETIAEALTNAGLEVESIERLGGAFSDVVVGHVLQVEQHPNADRLRLATVDLATEKAKVVCGGINLQEGMKVAFAKVGAQVINRKAGTSFVLEKAKIRGIESLGMICSIHELGLQDTYEVHEEGGIWPINAYVSDTQIGQDLKAALGLKQDTVLVAAPTANRGDLMSLVGVAREVAALFNRPLHLPLFEELSLPTQDQNYRVKLEYAEVCRYYGGLLLENITIKPSPDWMVARVQAAGVRSINNVVDITNYVMLELGQPLHAFDLDTLESSAVIGVRPAKTGEILKTLDGMERSLTEETVVITCNDRPVALAGVMGGEETGITDHSQRLLLESAYFPPASNRRSAKSTGLRTEASARFERGIDPGISRKALYRAMILLKELAGAKPVTLIESPIPAPTPIILNLRLSRIARILGITIEPETVQTILAQLGFGIHPQAGGFQESSPPPMKVPPWRGAGGDIFTVEVPSFRQEDVTREIDLIEELIRIYGYDRVPYTLPLSSEAQFSPVLSFRQEAIECTHRTFRGSGLQEVVTNSLIGRSLLEKTGFTVDETKLVTVTNSHSQDHTLMRQSLLPNLLEIAKYNQAQGNEVIWIYELGRTYFKLSKTTDKNAGVIEKLFAAGLMIGMPNRGQWHVSRSCDFYELKGVQEQVLEAFDLVEAVVVESEPSVAYFHPGKAAKLILSENKKTLGVFGELHPAIQESLKFRQPIYAFEWDLEILFKALAQRSRQEPRMDELSPYPAVHRDMAFSLPAEITHQQIITVLNRLNEPILTQIELFDEYRGAQVGEGHRSLAYRLTLQSDEQTLTDQLIDTAMARIKNTLSEALPVTFR